MAQIIDALVVTLGLDPSDFQKGQKVAAEGLKKTREEADKTKKGFGEYGKQAGETFEGLTRKALGFFAVLAGSKSVADFTTKIIGSDAALGRLAGTLGILPNNLAAMTMAVERNGGSADSAAKSFQGLSDSFENIKINGNDGIIPMLQKLQGAGGKSIDIFHGFAAALPGIADNLAELKRQGRDVDADYMARALGIDSNTAIWLEQGWPKIAKQIEESRRLGTPTQQWTKQAQELVTQFKALQQEIEGAGRVMVEKFAPAMSQGLKIVRDTMFATDRQIADDFHQTLMKMIQFMPDSKGAFEGAFKEMVKGAILWWTDQVNSVYRMLFGKDLPGYQDLYKQQQGGGSAGGGDYALPGGGGLGGLRGRRGGGGGRRGFMQGGGGPGGTSANSHELMNAARDQLAREGVDQAHIDAAAAALVGNVQQESRGNPNLIHDNGTGYGIYGARLARRDRMLAWLSQNGYARNSAEGQMRYMAHEAMTDPSYARTAEALRGADSTNLGRVTDTVALNFESPAPATANYGGRRANAAAALNSYRAAGSTAGASSAPPAPLAAVRPPPAPLAAVRPPPAPLAAVRPPPAPLAAVRPPPAPLAAVSPMARGLWNRPSDVYGDVMGGRAGAHSYTFHGAPSISHQNEVNIGNVTVHTQATDADGIAKSIKPAMQRHSFAVQANYGPF